MRSHLLLILATVLAAGARSGAAPPAAPPPKAAWDVRLAPAGEPGEPFELSGRLMGAGGPLEGVKLFAYHADLRGDYGRGHARLSAELRTGPQGRYRLRSVLPGSYGGYPRHVHLELRSTPGGAVALNVFKAGERVSGAPWTIARRGDDGIWRATWDLITGPNVRPALIAPADDRLEPLRRAAARADSLSQRSRDSSHPAAPPQRRRRP